MDTCLNQKTPCPVCGEGSLQDTTIDHTARMRYEGADYSVRVPNLVVSKCSCCGEVLFDNRADRQKQAALRQLLGVLQPEEIRRLRQYWQLEQRDVCRDMRIAIATLSRWENGHVIQSKAMDRFLRLYFTDPSILSPITDVVAEPFVPATAGFSWGDTKIQDDQLLAADRNYALAA